MAEKKKATKKKTAKKKKSLFRRILKAQMIVLLVAFITLAGLFAIKYGGQVMAMSKEAKRLVQESDYETFKATETSLVYDTNGDLMKTIKGEKEVYYLDLENIPKAAKDAMVSIEDKKFYKHGGIDIKANFRALSGYVVNRGKLTQGGGSTITQQLSRNVFLTNAVSWERKVQEIFVALNLEKKYSKDDILEFYLNNIYFANGYYGIQAASNGYFNKSVNSLSVSQIALLCSIPNSPTAYDPRVNLDRTLLRRDKILKNMYEDGSITEAEYNEALAEKITIKERKNNQKNYVETYVFDSATKALMKQNGFKFQYKFASDAEKESYMESYNELYASCQKSLYTAGYRIYTSIDLDKQDLLQESVNEVLAGFTDKTDEGIYKMQGAAATIDNDTGKVVAIVGGREQEEQSGYTLNRAYQSFRQPGSTIKPLIVYTPAFDKLGYGPNSVVDDSKMKPEENGPSNVGNSYLGKIDLRTAVEKSKNVVAWRIYKELTPPVGMKYLEEMQFSRITNQDYQNMAACLGGFAYGTNALEMAAGYATIENDGVFREPTCIVTITNSDGEVLVKDAQETKVVYAGNSARMMTDVLKGVLQRGTGAGLGSIPNMDTAGKTGTTNDYKDGWFCGYTPYYTTAVWVGYDQPVTVSGLQGASYPGQIWKQFMTLIHSGLERRTFQPYVSTGDKNMVAPPKTTEDTTEDTTEVTTEDDLTTSEAPPTTEAPTTEAPTTEAPTTEAPTTEAPTTEAPTEDPNPLVE